MTLDALGKEIKEGDIVKCLVEPNFSTGGRKGSKFDVISLQESEVFGPSLMAKDRDGRGVTFHISGYQVEVI